MGGEAVDVVFLLDVLNSDVISGHFGRLLAFVNDVIDRFPDVGRLATRVAMVTYAEHPRVEIYLDDFDSKTDLQVSLLFQGGHEPEGLNPSLADMKVLGTPGI